MTNLQKILVGKTLRKWAIANKSIGVELSTVCQIIVDAFCFLEDPLLVKINHALECNVSTDVKTTWGVNTEELTALGQVCSNLGYNVGREVLDSLVWVIHEGKVGDKVMAKLIPVVREQRMGELNA